MSAEFDNDETIKRKIEETRLHDHRELDRQSLKDIQFIDKYPSRKFYRMTGKNKACLGAWLRDRCAAFEALNYCCGLGDISLQLATHGAIVYGMDVPSNSVETTRTRLVEAGFDERRHFSSTEYC